VIAVFFWKNRFDKAEILLRQIMAVLRDARTPPCFEKMTALLVMDDKKSGRKRRIFVIIRYTLYLLSLIYLLFKFLSL
jgi:hypothetical protein